MKSEPKTVWLQVDCDWNPTEFRLIKEHDIFSFDKYIVFTASCDAYVLEVGPDAGGWSILIVNKEVQRFLATRKEEREKLFEL